MRKRTSALALPILLAALLLPRGAAAEAPSLPAPSRLAGGGAGYEKVSYGGGSRSADVTRYVLFGEMELPRLTLFGDDVVSLLLGVHTFELGSRKSTDPAAMAGISWKGTFARPAAPGGERSGFLAGWGVDGRLTARFYDSPESPAGTALDLGGEVLFRTRAADEYRQPAFFFGPSVRYGILPYDVGTTLDNGSRVHGRWTLKTDSVLDMVGVVAGANLPLGKRLLLRPEARVGADVTAYVSLLYLLSPEGSAAAPVPPPAAPREPAAIAPAGGDAGKGGEAEGAGAPPAKDETQGGAR